MFERALRKRYFLVFTIFISILLWCVLLFQGLPIGDPDDWEHVLASQDASGTLLTKNFLIPWSTSKHWIGQTDLPDRTFHKRLFHTIALKAVQHFFGYRPFPYYFILKGLFFSGTCTILFLLLLKASQSLFFSFLGLAFFAMVPAHYASLLWVSDSTTMLQFFIILGLCAFVSCSANLKNKGPSIHFFGLVSLLFFCAWIAIKTKETAFILPSVSIIYMISEIHLLKIAPLKWLTLFILLCLIAFQVVPIGHLVDEAQHRFYFELETVKRMLLRNYSCGYDDEKVTAFFSLEHIWPVSIARTFGFFALWLLVICFTATFIRMVFLKITKRWSPKSSFRPLIKISLLWILTEAILFGFFQPDPRYFSTIMIPITIFVFGYMAFAAGLCNKQTSRLLAIAVLGAFTWTLFENFQHVIFLRQQIGQRTNRFLNVPKVIYKDLFSETPTDMRKIGLFYCPSYIAPDTGPRLKELTFYVALGYGQWNRTETPTLTKFLQLAPQGTPYIATYDNTMFRHSAVKKIATISGINRSILEKLIYQLKQKQPRPLYVLKYNP